MDAALTLDRAWRFTYWPAMMVGMWFAGGVVVRVVGHCIL